LTLSGAVRPAVPSPASFAGGVLAIAAVGIADALTGVEIGPEIPQAGPLNVGAEEGAAEWVFSVSDRGIGIDPADRERIFRVFERAHPDRSCPGTGIGLAVCRKIVESRGGRIRVDSERGRGATFRFTIPRA
jgi:signal transduction histidine kinase